MSEGEGMQFVQRVTSGDGKVRLYFRKKGHPRRPLLNAWGTPELEAEVQAILAAETAPKALPGLLSGAIRAYELEDADYKGLASSTQYLYRCTFNELADDFGAVPIASFTAAYILDLRNLWAERGHRAANIRLQVLKNVLWPHIVGGKIEGGDPFALIPQVRRPAGMVEPHILWPDDVVDKVIRAAIRRRKFGLARAVALGRWTGARRGDLVTMGLKVRQQGRVRFLSGKRKIQVDIAEDPQLTAWLAQTPDTQPPEPRQGRKVKADAPTPLRPLTLVYNLASVAYSEDGLGQELSKLLVEMIKAQEIGEPLLDAKGEIVGCAYNLHGLRHTRGVELALAGCTDAEGAAMMGHASPASFAQYRRQADKIRLANAGSAKVEAMRERAKEKQA